MIAVRDLRVRYPAAREDAVRDFVFTAASAEVIVISGPNGSGKTTGLKALAGLVAARVRDSSTGPEQIAYVHQDPYMFARRVSGNIAYGLRSTGTPRALRHERVRRAAQQCAVDDLLDRRATHLSGGQRQRVAIARALALERPILALDEPTANLDGASRTLVARIVRRQAAAGRTVLIASHDEAFALSVADRVFAMDQGVLAEEAYNILPGVPWYRDAVSDHREHLTEVTIGAHVTLTGVPAPPLSPDAAAARLVFRPEDVVLSRRRMESSALNELSVTVETVTPTDDGILVSLQPDGAPDVRVLAAVTKRSREALSLEPGAGLYASVKATSVRVYPDYDPAAARNRERRV